MAPPSAHTLTSRLVLLELRGRHDSECVRDSHAPRPLLELFLGPGMPFPLALILQMSSRLLMVFKHSLLQEALPTSAAPPWSHPEPMG